MNIENVEFTFEETQEGYTVFLKGDKEKLKSKIEAFQAFLNFREKAKAAGMDHHNHLAKMHQMFKEKKSCN